MAITNFDNVTVDVQSLKPFKKFIMSIGEIPTSYLNSLSYAELVMWFCDYLQNKVIPTVNNNGEAVEELQNLYIEIKTYVENYFNNLDVQEEINNKLDEMVEDGTLDSILNNYVKVTKVYNTHDEMINDETLVNNMKVKTLGYYEINDGGGAEYYITNVQKENIYQENTSIDTLFAELLTDNGYIEIFGAKGDNTNDDSIALNNACKYFNIVKLMKKEYLIENYILINENSKVNIIDGNGATLNLNNTTGYNNEFAFIIRNRNNIDINNLNFIKNTRKTAFGLYTCSFIKINNCYLYSENISGTLIDFYDENKNCEVNNCSFINKVTDGIISERANICMEVRNLNNSISENISFKNCYFEKYGIDEIYAVWGWNGNCKNISLENCTLKRNNGSSQVLISHSCEKGYINNCKIISETLSDTSITFFDLIRGFDIIVSNSEINVDWGYNLSFGKVDFNNCKINNTSNKTLQLSRYDAGGNANFPVVNPDYYHYSNFNKCLLSCNLINLGHARITNSHIIMTNEEALTQRYISKESLYIENVTIDNLNLLNTTAFIEFLSDNQIVEIYGLIINKKDSSSNMSYFLKGRTGAKIKILNSKFNGSFTNMSGTSGFIINSISNVTLSSDTLTLSNNSVYTE